MKRRRGMTKVGVLTVISLLLICLVAALPSAALVLDDPLTSSDPSTSTPERFITYGGSFGPDGWRVTSRYDRIIWHMPHTIQKGKVEFDLKGIRPNECDGEMYDKIELFHMYDWTYIDSAAGGQDGDHNYWSYRNNPYKHFIRKIGCNGGTADAFELLLKTPFAEAEPDSPFMIWDADTTYHMMETWETINGECVCKVYRDGVLLRTMTVLGAYNPVGHSVRIGSTGSSYSASIGAIYSNIKLTDLSVTIPLPPVITEPANGVTINTDTVFVKWTGGEHTKYQVRISTSNTPESGVVWDSGEANSAYDFAWTGKLSNLTNYYVFARIGNDAGWSEWSAAGRWFRVDTGFMPSGDNIVRVQGNSIADNDGPFLGLGITYMQALRRCKYDRARYRSDLATISSNGFNYIRILSMVGWDDLEIAPLSFINLVGHYVTGWPDYWQQFRDMIDIAYDEYGLRTEITIFADAQYCMPNSTNRVTHMDGVLSNIIGREHKIVQIEVANEFFKNGFSDDLAGIATVRSYGQHLADETSVPVSLSAPSDSMDPNSICELYCGSAADITTLHLDRDIGTFEGGWKPVRAPWFVAPLYKSLGIPPASSNEPIGAGSSVNTENDPIRLCAAGVYAWISNLPMYVYHSRAGTSGEIRFEDTAGISAYQYVMQILPKDLSSWVRNNGKESSAPFTAYCNNSANTYWTDNTSGSDGCHSNIGALKGSEFVCFPMGIRSGGVKLEARKTMTFKVYDLLTGNVVPDTPTVLMAGSSFILTPDYSLASDPNSSKDYGAYIIKGEFTDLPPAKTLDVKLGGNITVDGNSSDWNISQFTKLIRGGQAGNGDTALVGFDGATCYYGGKAGDCVLPTNAADHTAKVYSRHDSTYQYFLLRIDDNDIRYNNGVDLNWSNDCVEFYIDPGNDGGSDAIADSTSDIQLVIDANNQKNVYMCTDTYKNQVLAGVTSAVVRDGTGWWLEVRIAKNALDPDLPAVGTFKVDFCFRDNDNNNDSALTTVYAWSDNTPSGGFPSKIPNKWGSAYMNGTNLAQYISDTIPATMDSGKSYNVSVTMKNTGTNTWTAAREYKLGAINDTDPFAYGRQDLSAFDSIAPNQQKTFNFTMTAPVGTGPFTTDWRMLQEAVEWFGDTLLKQVSVVNTLPPAAVTNFKATGGNGQMVLSWTNSTDADYIGTMIRYKTTGYPTSTTDGILVIDKAGPAGGNSSHTQTGLTNGTTYYYTAFAHDYVPNYATAVTATGIPTDACFVEPFAYANGNLNGNGGWDGSATTEIAVSSQTVRFNGGTGDADAIRSVTTCSGVTGSIGVSAKVRAGFGTSTLWSMYIDDPQNRNLARVYGSAATARGRIGEGGTVTTEKFLTGNWDDIYVKINFITNTSDFYLNGVLMGSLSHVETSAGDSIGRIRLFRNDSTTTANNYFFLDSISVGPADITAPVAAISEPSVSTIATGTVRYTVTFSEAVIGFTAADIQVNKTGAVSSGSASITGSNPYTVTIPSVSGNGTISLSVKASSVVDAAGNANALTTAATRCVVIASDGSLAAAKTATENSVVTIGNKILYYKNGTVGYIEEEDRFAGLRVEGAISSAINDKVSFSGMLKTNASGEKYVLLDQLATVIPGYGSVGALGTNNRAVTSSVMDGLLVTVWGTVKAGSVTANSFVITDGSDEEGIRVITIGLPGVSPDTYVTVTGAAGIEAGKRVIYKK